MFFTIIYFTYRPGGIDMLAHSLEKQIHRDYELIVVDDLKGRDCKKYLEEHDIPVKYYGPSKPKCYPDTPFGGCNAVNTGLLKASKQCDATILVEDYAWLMPDAIQRWENKINEMGDMYLMTGVGVEWKYKPPQHLGYVTVWDEEFTGDDADQWSSVIDLGADYEFVTITIPTIVSATISVGVLRNGVITSVPSPVYALSDAATGCYLHATTAAVTAMTVVYRIGGARYFRIKSSANQTSDVTFYVKGFNRQVCS